MLRMLCALVLFMMLAAGTKISNGVLLGTSVGGGMVYIEPGTVSCNGNA